MKKHSKAWESIAVCDRCGAETKVAEGLYFESVILDKDWFILYVNSVSGPICHLCPKCATDFEEWYNQKDHSGKAKKFRQ